MMKFAKVKHTKYDIEYDWMLVIDSIEDLNSYHTKNLKSQIRRTWDNLIEVSQNRSHVNSSLGMLIKAKAEYLAEIGEKKSLVEISVMVGGEIYAAKAKAIFDAEKIYVNYNGGFFPHHNDLKIIEEIEVEGKNLIFPNYSEKDIRIKQWPGGEHHYAYVGNFQVENLDGKNKWDTDAEARKNAKYFLARINRLHFKIKE